MIGFMKAKLPDLNMVHAYRIKVALRCAIAIISGFLMANLCIPLLAYSLPVLRAEISFASATALGFLVSFIVWLLFILYAFADKSLLRVFGLSSMIIVLQSLVIAAFKYGWAV